MMTRAARTERFAAYEPVAGAAIHHDTAVLVVLVAAYLCAAAAFSAVFDQPLALLRLTASYLLTVLPFPLFMLVLGALRAVRRDPLDQRAAIRTAWRKWRSNSGLSRVIVVLLMPVFMAGFTSFKLMIPAIQPFVWDERLAHWDRLLHGADPWTLLQPMLGQPVLTFGLNALYYPLWFCLNIGGWVLVATGDHPRRQQFLLSFLLLWILPGTIGAIAFSSAGPILYDRVTGDGELFEPLLRYLESVNDQYPLLALAARDRLWETYLASRLEIGTGISAMPSMHVAMVTLCTIFSWHLSRGAGLIMTVYAVVIAAASVHLGWHYALDGYMAILATVAIWACVGWALRRIQSAGAHVSSNPARNATRLRPSSSLG